jgi:hypothetical protein
MVPAGGKVNMERKLQWVPKYSRWLAWMAFSEREEAHCWNGQDVDEYPHKVILERPALCGYFPGQDGRLQHGNQMKCAACVAEKERW